MTSKLITASVLTAATLVLASCDEDELILDGERFDTRGAPIATDIEDVERSRPISLVAPVTNANWTHVNGSVEHRIAHPSLDRTLSRVWSVPIGEGNTKRQRLTADPVVADGRVFTLDSQAQVTAFTTDGNLLWQRDLTPSSDASNDASGGGVAFASGRLYVTSGFGSLAVLDAATGETIWTQDLEAAATGAPTVFNGVVYLVTRNAIGWALDINSGRILWQVIGASSPSGLTGGPAPAISGPLVIFPFSSGQMLAAVQNTGATAWVASVPGQRQGRAFSRISDLSGDPVVDGDRIFAGNHSGRAAAFDASTGVMQWTASEGAVNPVWRAGDSVFMVSDDNRLIRLDAETGETVWSVDLPLFLRESQRRRKSTYVHFGPILAGGQLLVASDDGVLRAFSPESGALISETELPNGAARNPVVAGGTLYLITENGQLHAFR
ncbi:MAG: PQQ-binding-like beta-propeller repeat protein [Boseongicola sp.]|nr:PQQ-binding-like beta-propeller repeat protein [Boseongicola sp.]